MTKLLATRDSIEALAYARRMIERVHRADENGGSFFDPPRSREFVRNFLRLMLSTVDGRLTLLDLARVGEEDAQTILRTTILELESRREPLPAEFEGYKMELIGGRVPPLMPGDGPDKRDRLPRDIAITVTVAAVCDRFGLKPTGRSVRKRSGSSIVAEALGVIDRRMEPKAIEAIARRYWRSMPTVPGWTSAPENQ